jgi:hypothetical protein
MKAMSNKGRTVWAPVEFLRVLNGIKSNEGLYSEREAMLKCAEYAEMGKISREYEQIRKLKGIL